MMMHFLTMLAEVPPGSGDTITVAGLILLLSGLAAFFGRMQGIQKGRKEVVDVTVQNNPLRVQMEKEFVRREEWTQWRGEVRADLAKLEGMMQRVFDRVDSKHSELLLTIEKAAKTGVDGRVALWNELKAQGRELAVVSTHTNVAGAVKDLAEELKQSRIRPAK
jgi:glycogen debranching enzyme